MGKKAPTQPEVDPETAARVAELKKQAEVSFLAKEFGKAAESYEQAIKLLGDGPGKAPLLLPAAGCYFQEKRFKDVVKATTAVLEQLPTSAAALKTRAKAYEQLGFIKQALADVQTINKGDSGSAETRDMERRLLDVVSANKAKLSGPRTADNRNPFPYSVTIKASLGDETKVVQASLVVTYAELLETIKSKFPDAGPIVLKYTDKEGDNVTITSRHDIQSQLSEIVMQYQRQMHGSQAPKLGNSLPPMRIQVVKVGSEAEVPKPPADELPQKTADGKEAQPQQPRMEPDEWLVEFARLFSEITGIDPVAHHEHINLGNEKLNKAMEAPTDEKAQGLFDKASDHFKDATSASFIQWGNVYVIRADRQGQALIKSGKGLEGKPLDAMLKEYDEAEKKYQEAIKIKADSWEAHGSLGQLEWERAKAKMGYVLPAPTVEDPATSKEGEEVKEDTAAVVKEALSKIDAKKVGQVQKHLDNSNKWFEQALTHAKAAEERKKQEEQAEAEAAGTTAEKQPETAEQQQQLLLQSPTGNMLVMQGNIQYEWSQVLAAASKEWKPVLDAAVAKFRAAGAAETDIRNALKTHSRKDELDLGPDPEPEQPKEEAKEDKAKAPAPEAKGLPSLEVKKKAKA